MGHTRLAILDLSDAAQQPMTSPDGRFVLSYNGEIYNYVELREELRRAGWPLRGSGDTEVLLGLLAMEGAPALSKLRGMFAFVLWDREAGRGLAARDPLGIKPLYWSSDRRGTVISSELQAMTALGRGEALDDVAVEDVLLTGSVAAPRTILAGVRALQPGHLLEIDAGRVAERRYWQPPAGPGEQRSEAELAEELDGLLRESVRQQLRADVPLGTFLSGGLDSALVTSYAAEELGGTLRTFSVGFESEDPAWDETGPAALVADRFATQHRRVVVTRPEFEQRMPELARAIDQPSADGVNSHFVCGAAAPEVTVCLSGQGGDELFGGYNIFRFASRLNSILSRVPRTPGGLARLGQSARSLPARLQFNWYVRGLAGALAGGDAALLADLANPLFGPGEIGARSRRPPDHDSDGDLINGISRRLIETYLPNTLLRDMDAMSMAHSLEVRVPLVDDRLAAFALSVPGAQKVSFAESKRPLRALARRRLPAELLDLPKHGFTFPLSEWLRHPSCLARIEATLAPDAVSEAGLVDPFVVERELGRLRRPRPGDIGWLRAQRVWTLYVLHEWRHAWREARAGAAVH